MSQSKPKSLTKSPPTVFASYYKILTRPGLSRRLHSGSVSPRRNRLSVKKITTQFVETAGLFHQVHLHKIHKRLSPAFIQVEGTGAAYVFV